MSIRLLGLHCDHKKPLRFTMITQDPTNKNRGYMWEIETGPRKVIRGMLLAGGMSVVEVNRRFAGA